MDKIYDKLLTKTDDHVDKSLILDDTGFYQFTIVHMDEDNIYITPLEDDWYLVEYQLSEWHSDEMRGGYNKDPHFYVCDGWDGLIKFIDDII